MQRRTTQQPFFNLLKQLSAENVAKKFGLTRAEQDQFAFESQAKAKVAIDGGHYDNEIVAVTVAGRKGPTLVSKDEHPRPETTVEALAKLRPAFDKAGTVTAGNASGFELVGIDNLADVVAHISWFFSRWASIFLRGATRLISFGNERLPTFARGLLN